MLGPFTLGQTTFYFTEQNNRVKTRFKQITLVSQLNYNSHQEAVGGHYIKRSFKPQSN